MNFGFNSNVRVGDSTYHVQSEDRGRSHPFHDTVVYLAGRVIFKRSTSYEEFARETEAETLAKKLHERLAQQHREVIAALEAETLPLPSREKPRPPEDTAGEDESLDLRLTNPKSWFKAGNVTFNIELYGSRSKKGIGDADVQACLEDGKHRTSCAEMRTDAGGCATLKFPMPAKVKEGAALVVRATDGTRYGELRFRLKSKSSDKTPTPVSQ